MLDPLFFEEKSQKQVIIDSLAETPNIGAKKIHNELKKKIKKSFTYQSTFKALSELVNQKIF